MKIPVVMPQLGLTMTEGTVTEWLIKVGATVKKDDLIFVVSTDKADVEIEATADGILQEIVAVAGTTLSVGTAVAYLEVEASVDDLPAAGVPVGTKDLIANGAAPRVLETDDPDDPLPFATEPASVSGFAPPSGKRAMGGTPISPRARKLAAQHGIDIDTLTGTGPGGRIVEADVLGAGPKQALSSSRTDSHPPAAAPSTGPALPAATSNDARRRLLIASRMVESITTIPAFSVTLEVNAQSLVSFYEHLGEPIKAATGVKLTYTDLLLKAVCLSLEANPSLNAAWENGIIQPRTSVDIGLAVATTRDVAAPVVAGVDRLSLRQLVKQRHQLTDRARQGRLAPNDLVGGSGTLSNLGMFGIDSFEGIITPGQTYLLAVGRLASRPWVLGTELVVRPTIVFSLSVDHRVADGAMAAKFLEHFAAVIENPYQLLWSQEA